MLEPYVSMLFTVTHRLLDVQYPVSLWSVARSLVTGRCGAAGQNTADLVDRRVPGHSGRGTWDGIVVRAGELVVEARLFLAADSRGLTTEMGGWIEAQRAWLDVCW